MTIGDNGRLDCRTYNSGEAFDEIAKLKKANEVLVDSVTGVNERYQKLLICVGVIEQKLVDAESKYDELQSNISELQDLDVSAADFGFPEIKPNLFDFPPKPDQPSALSKCEAPAFVEIAQRLAMIEGALKGMNEVDFGPELEDSEDDAAEAFGVDMSPEFAEMFNELPKFNDLMDSSTTNEQDITVRYLKAKDMINANETLFEAVVGIVDELERERRIL